MESCHFFYYFISCVHIGFDGIHFENPDWRLYRWLDWEMSLDSLAIGLCWRQICLAHISCTMALTKRLRRMAANRWRIYQLWLPIFLLLYVHVSIPMILWLFFSIDDDDDYLIIGIDLKLVLAIVVVVVVSFSAAAVVLVMAEIVSVEKKLANDSMKSKQVMR